VGVDILKNKNSELETRSTELIQLEYQVESFQENMRPSRT
jgi:hypothetical protein